MTGVQTCALPILELDEIADNVVKVTSAGWHEMGLDWSDPIVSSANTVVYANFSKNEN